MRLLQTLYQRIEEHPNQIAVQSKEDTFTYSDMKHQIDVWKSELKRCGVYRRAKVVICVKEAIHIVGVYFALCELDCIIIPVDCSVKDSTISEIIKSSKCQFVLSVQALDSAEFQNVTPILSECKLYKTSYQKEETQNDVLQFLYTSGTTGLPKCVMFSKESIANNILRLSKSLGLTKDDVVYTPISLMLPAAFNTVLLPALLTGAKVFVSESTVPGSVLRNVMEQGVTVFFSVPFYYTLLASNGLCKEETWKNTRLCLTSSAYLSEDNFYRFYEKSKQALHSIYCSSEAGTIAYNGSENLESLCKYVGKPLSGCEVSLIHTDSDGIGEIIVRGEMVSLKYYENEALNHEVYRNGWVKTGDLGLIHENGTIEIKGRISETINVAGYLVNPLEVEQVIMNMKEVSDVVAYLFNNYAGHSMLGVNVVLKAGSSLKERDMIKWCEAALPNYKVPKKVKFTDHIDIGRYGKKIRSV